MAQLIVRCDAGSPGRFDIGTDTLSVPVGQTNARRKEEEPDRSHLPALSSTPRWYACSMGCVSAAGYTRALKAGEACLGSTQPESDAHRHV